MIISCPDRGVLYATIHLCEILATTCVIKIVFLSYLIYYPETYNELICLKEPLIIARMGHLVDIKSYLEAMCKYKVFCSKSGDIVQSNYVQTPL